MLASLSTKNAQKTYVLGHCEVNKIISTHEESLIMNKCQVCGAEHDPKEIRCADCGTFYPTLAELLAAEEMYEEQQTFKGFLKRILGAESVRQGVCNEFKLFKAGLSNTALFTLYVIAAFIFALLITVI